MSPLVCSACGRPHEGATYNFRMPRVTKGWDDRLNVCATCRARRGGKARAEAEARREAAVKVERVVKKRVA